MWTRKSFYMYCHYVSACIVTILFYTITCSLCAFFLLCYLLIAWIFSISFSPQLVWKSISFIHLAGMLCLSLVIHYRYHLLTSFNPNHSLYFMSLLSSMLVPSYFLNNPNPKFFWDIFIFTTLHSSLSCNVIIKV